MSQVAEALRKVERDREIRRESPKQDLYLPLHHAPHHSPKNRVQILFLLLVVVLFLAGIYVFGVNQGIRLAEEDVHESLRQMPPGVLLDAAGFPVPKNPADTLTSPFVLLDPPPEQGIPPADESTAVSENKILPAEGTDGRMPAAVNVTTVGSRTQPSDEISAVEIPVTQTPVFGPGQEFYTIQLVTYERKTTAEREAKKLANQGMEAFVLAKGKYFLVCLGHFLRKEQALEQLEAFKKSALEKTYRGAMLRKEKPSPA